MIKTFDLQDDNFYRLLKPEVQDYYQEIRKAKKDGLVPSIKIIRQGHISSWYNKFLDKTYEIERFIIDTNNGYINFLVKSGADGTKNGYKPKFSNFAPGSGLVIVHIFNFVFELYHRW